MKDVKIDISSADKSKLGTEQGIQSEADRLLPKFLRQVGEKTAALAWDELQKSLKGSGIKPNRSSADRNKYIRESGEAYLRSVTADSKQKSREAIIEALRKAAE